MKLNATNLRWVLLGLITFILIAGIVGGAYAVGFVRSQISETNKVKIDAETTSDAGASAALAKNELSKPEVAQLLEYASQIVPKETYRTQFLADIKKYSDDSNLTLTNITFNDAATAPGATAPAAPPPGLGSAKAIPVTLTFGAGARYSNFISFTKKIENNLQYMQITSLNLQPDTANASALASVTIEMQLYVEK